MALVHNLDSHFQLYFVLVKHISVKQMDFQLGTFQIAVSRQISRTLSYYEAFATCLDLMKLFYRLLYQQLKKIFAQLQRMRPD